MTTTPAGDLPAEPEVLPEEPFAGFSLELDVPPALAARLPRHPAMASGPGRARGTAERLIWYDTAEGALAADGLLLEEYSPRGQRRLVRAWDTTAPPGLPPRIVEAELPEEAVVALAAFEGKLTLRRLAPPEGPVLASLRQGRLRAVAAEAEIARLVLEGPPEAVMAVARALCASLPLIPPSASLPEVARALARGEAPRPRRRGPAVPAPGASMGDALAEAIGHLTEVLLIQAPAAHDGTGPEGVHQMRVATRRLRSVLKLFRPQPGFGGIDTPSLRTLDAELGEVASRLGPARDWDVFLGGIGAALAEAAGEEKRVAVLLRAAQAEREAAYTALREVLDGPGWRLLMLDAVAAARLQGWRAEAGEGAVDAPLAPFAAEVMRRRWRRLRRAARDIETLSITALHALRLDSKRVRYAAEVFSPLWPGSESRRFGRRLAAVQEALGVANDGAVARELATRLAEGGGRAGASRVSRQVPPWAIGLLEGYALARTAGARDAAIAAWKLARKAPEFWKTTPEQ